MFILFATSLNIAAQFGVDAAWDAGAPVAGEYGDVG